MGIESRGFASMNKEKHRKIASMGGKAANGKNLTLEGRRKGGLISRRGKTKTTS